MTALSCVSGKSQFSLLMIWNSDAALPPPRPAFPASGAVIRPRSPLTAGSTAQKGILPVPGEERRTRPQCLIRRQQDRLTVIRLQCLLIRTLLAESSRRHDHLAVVRQRPQTIVEQPVRILAQRQAVL